MRAHAPFALLQSTSPASSLTTPQVLAKESSLAIPLFATATLSIAVLNMAKTSTRQNMPALTEQKINLACGRHAECQDVALLPLVDRCYFANRAMFQTSRDAPEAQKP